LDCFVKWRRNPPNPSTPIFRFQGYVEAARMFEKESGTPPGVNLDAITDRMEVRRALQGGDVESAMERVNDLDPEVQQFFHV
jgi:hypothetical protein